MNKQTVISGIGMLFFVLLSCSNEQKDSGKPHDNRPHVTAGSHLQAGRYLIISGGCNECHTAGFMQNNNIPESEWLTGSPLGWQGPWGTTYPVNLRLSIQNYSEEDWVRMAQTRNARPPMAWFSLNNMSEKDLKAIYAYIKSMGPKGKAMPSALPPGQKPETPFISLIPENMSSDSASMHQQ